MLSQPLQPVQRIAAIDLGTNSFHAIIVDIYPDGSFLTVDKLKEMVFLAEKGFDNSLSMQAMQRGLDALMKIKTLCDRQNVEHILAYATSAIREAENGGEFIQTIIDKTGIKALAISGIMEADLIGHAVRHTLSLGNDPVLIIDIGGGSVEFIVSDKYSSRFLASYKIGVARIKSRFIDKDPIDDTVIHQIITHYADQISSLNQKFDEHTFDTLVGSSGTMENIAAMIAIQNGTSPDITLNEFDYTPDQFAELYGKLIKMNPEERQKVSGIDPNRAELIVPGLILVDLIIRRFRIQHIKTSTQALREGIILRYIKHEMEHLKLMDYFADTRHKSVFEFLRRSHWHEHHSRHVAKMAIILFDAMRSSLGLTDNDRDLLEYAALMHDIGYFISRRRHHKHALYMIRNADLRGFDEREINIMANVARYHRRSAPAKRHPEYDNMDSDAKDIIKKLSGILRVADGLDRSHYQNVQELEINLTKKEVRIGIRTLADPELEIWGADRKKQLLEEVTSRKIFITDISADN